jgi:chromosome segregation ATPase
MAEEPVTSSENMEPTPAPPAAPQPPKKGGMGKTVLVIIVIVGFLLCACVGCISFLLISRSSQADAVEQKYAKINKNVKTIDSQISEIEKKEADLVKADDKANQEIDALNAKIAASDKALADQEAKLQAWNNQSHVSSDSGLIDQVNGLVSEQNSLRDQLRGQLDAYDAVFAQGAAMEASLKKVKADYTVAKDKLTAIRASYKLKTADFEQTDRDMSVLSMDFDSQVAKLNGLVKAIDISKAPAQLKIAQDKAKALDAAEQAYIAHTAKAKTMFDDILAKEARMAQIDQQLSQLWPS